MTWSSPLNTDPCTIRSAPTARKQTPTQRTVGSLLRSSLRRRLLARGDLRDVAARRQLGALGGCALRLVVRARVDERDHRGERIEERQQRGRADLRADLSELDRDGGVR